MKKILLLLVFPIFILAQEQENTETKAFENAFERREVIIDLYSYLQSTQGKKGEFIRDIYDFQLGVGLGGRVSYKALYGLGFEYLFNHAKIKDKTLIGPFEDAKMDRISYFAFGQYPISEGINVEGRMGLGQMEIKHFYEESKYRLSYHYFLLGTGMYYSLTKTHSIRAFLNYDIQFVKASSRQELPGPYSKQFSKTHLNVFGLGMKFSF